MHIFIKLKIYNKYKMTKIKNTKKELKDRLAALMIYKELKESTNENIFISSTDLSKNLKEKYGKDNAPSHNTVARYLKAMKDYGDVLEIDIRKGNSKQGYCLASREFSKLEMSILIDATIKNKTLSQLEKKEIIDKCINYLGLDINDDEYIKIINELMKSKNKNHKEKRDNTEIINTLEKATHKHLQAEMILMSNYAGTKNTNTKSLTINPYKLFQQDHKFYLLYSIKDFNEENKNIPAYMRQVTISEISDIFEVKILNNKDYYPIEKFDDYKDGIDEVEFNKDPFKYIFDRNNKAIEIELIDNPNKEIEHTKRIMKKEFNENVVFYHQGDREIAYVSDNIRKIDNFLLNNFNNCFVIGPEDYVETFKDQIRMLADRYKI